MLALESYATTPKGTKKNTFVLSKKQARRVAQVLAEQGEKELAGIFNIEHSFTEVKQMVIQSIRSGEPDKDLIKDLLHRIEKEEILNR